MPDLHLRNFALLDTVAGRLETGYECLIRGKTIAALEKAPLGAADVRSVDLGGRTLMPGLIDCHVHMAPGSGLAGPKQTASFIAVRATLWLKQMVRRGFTTVRDAGGADVGFRQGVERGLIIGPRLFVSGRAISQTGGHGDKRSAADGPSCNCDLVMGSLSRIADGVPEVLRAVRDELRMGANQIKVMAGGGVSSPADAIAHLQYSMDELRAMVDETARQNTYCMAHVYSAPGIKRAVEAGIRTIEHGNFIDDDGARLMVERGAYLVPTLVTYRADAKYGQSVGFTPESLVKNDEVLEAGTRSLAIAAAAGVKIAYGTDLAFSPKTHQPEEFLVRAEVQKAADVIRSATVIGAEVVRMEGKIGVVAPGAFADLLAIDGNPLEDLRLLQGEGEHMAMILKEGAVVKDLVT